MAMRSRLLFKLILVLAPALVACDSGDPVVARVGEVDIALSEVEHFVAGANARDLPYCTWGGGAHPDPPALPPRPARSRIST